MASVSVKELLEAGVHYGHQTSRWNPKMRPYIFGDRNGIYLINLEKTAALLVRALDEIKNTVSRGGQILFVGTKRQAQDTIREEAARCDMHFVNNRWLGGTLTNFKTIKQSIDKLRNLEKLLGDPETRSRLPKKEIVGLEKELAKLNKSLSGIKNMRGLPALIFLIDPSKERIAVEEGNALNIPVVALTDTDGDPDDIDYLIPGNDDALKSIKLISQLIADACIGGLEVSSKALGTASIGDPINREVVDDERVPSLAEAQADQTEARV